MANERLLYSIDLYGGCRGLAEWRKFHPDEPIDLSNVSLDGENFSFCDLPGADFHNSSLEDTNFFHSNLAGANFLGVFMDGANFQWTNLSGAKIREESVEYADFTGCLGLTFTPYELIELMM